MSYILISGGSGLIGRYLVPPLQEKGYSVTVLTRGISGEKNGIRYYQWDVQNQRIDSTALENTEVIIHLAGANIVGRRWTGKRKQEIIDSRVQSAKLLLRAIRETAAPLKVFISSSAVGYYGATTSDHIFHEDDPSATDFMGTICRLWEEAADRFADLNVRVVKLRTGVVLTRQEGALEKMMLPVKLGLGAPLGSGQQYLPWIHINDLVNIYLKAVEDEQFSGAYNAVAPRHVTNEEFIYTLAQVLHKPFFLPPVPAFLLKLVYGEMATTVLEGSRVSAEKLHSIGYSFRYTTLSQALQSLFS